jgi:hypothetical protein
VGPFEIESCDPYGLAHGFQVSRQLGGLCQIADA